MRTLGLGFFTSLTLPFVLVAACSGGDESKVVGGGGIGAAAGAGGGAGTGGGIVLDSGSGGATQCGPNNPCETGVCEKGICCDSPGLACNGQCCASGDVCLFEQCKTPGKACQSSADCGEGKYCETSLGNNPDGGSSDGGPADGGNVCVTGVSTNGRCVDLPPICGQGDAGTDGGCFEKCEYFPPAGQLNPVKKWQWGQDIKPPQFPGFIDTWSTPTVGRIYDSNCDGNVTPADSPAIVFVSGNGQGTCCQCTGAASAQSACKTGVLRAVDGRTGTTLWSLRKAETSSVGFAAMSIALGDTDGDGTMEIVALTGEGKLALISGDGKVLGLSNQPYANAGPDSFGWGGGIALGDMDNDGKPEAAFGSTIWTINGTTITRIFNGPTGAAGGGVSTALSFFEDLDGNGSLELVASNAAYLKNGTTLWDRSAAGSLGPAIPNGLSAAADFDGDQKPEIVVVSGGQVWILEGATGATELGPVTLPGAGSGGPPTVADFDGDKKAEIGVAQKDKYSMLKPDYTGKTITAVWSAPNHDLSSSVTGSSVFDFEGDGKAEVIYNDECFLWVYDGSTGKVLLAELTTSFTGTEASIVADVDGDGHSEIVMVSNGADPTQWRCTEAPWNKADPANNRPAWKPPAGQTAYRGLTVWGDKANSWVGTRTLWNQHAYSVSNVCDDRDSACITPNTYGLIPKQQQANWTLPWLNNFRQNVQDKGLFDAPDAVVSVFVECSDPVIVHVTVRNIGLSGLPAGVPVDVFNGNTKIGSVTTTQPLGPGQSATIPFSVPSGSGGQADTYSAKVAQDPNNKTFNECREDNNDAIGAKAECGPK
ncbi:MAG: FG-GAP-like repeat-containing protein [Polyangiaceae bacterium]